MSKKKKVNSLIGFSGILISLGATWYIIEKFDIKGSWGIVKEASPLVIIFIVLVYLSTFGLRALRWKLMLLNNPEISFKLLIESIIIGFAGNNVIPARGGEIVRMEYFSRQSATTRTTALTSIGLEKVLDATILLFFLFILNLWINDRNIIFFKITLIMSLIFIPLILFLLILKIKGTLIISWIKAKKFNYSELVIKHFERFQAALSFLKADVNTLKILIISMLIWIVEGSVFILVLKIVGLNESLISIGFLALCIVNFGILVPSSPGYIGVFQGAIILALSSFRIPEQESIAAAIIIHSCQFFPTTFLGLIIFIKKLNFISKSRKEKGII